MYSYDFYKEKVIAEELIPAGTTIGIPYQSNMGRKFVSPNSRLGEFLNEASNGYNAQYVKTNGVGMLTYYMVEACTDIQPGEEIIVCPDRYLNTDLLKKNFKKDGTYALNESKKFRINNIPEIMECYENIDQCTDVEDRLKLIKTLKEAVKVNNLNLKLSIDEDNNNQVEIFTEAAMNNNKRKKIENHILNVFSKLDKSGLNTNFYKNAFEKMNDNQFDSFIKKLIYNDEENFYLEIQAHKNEPSLKEIKEALKYMNVPLNEYVYFRYEEDVNDPVRTRYKVPVGYIFVKRLQQILSKKNTYSTSIKSRNLKTGAVSGEDKVARISDAETFVMTATGLDKALEEFMGPRADGGDIKNSMYNQISTYGYCTLEECNKHRDLSKKQTLNTVSVYLTGAGIVNDLLVDDINVTGTDNPRARKESCDVPEDDGDLINLNESHEFIFNEAKFFAKQADFALNMNEWQPKVGKNIAYLTGLSGAGKSTITKKLKNIYAQKGYSVETIELDAIEQKKTNIKNKKLKELMIKAGEVIPEYGNAVENALENLDSSQYNRHAKYAMEAIRFVVDELYKDNNTLYIIEGIQIFEAWKPVELAGKPIIFKNTSTFESLLRRFKRNAAKEGSEKIMWNKELKMKLLTDVAWMVKPTREIKKYEKELTKDKEVETGPGGENQELLDKENAKKDIKEGEK